MSNAAAVWRDGVMRSLVAFSEDQPRDDQGQWTSDGSDQSGSQADEEAKRLYAELLNLPPEQRDKFLAGLNNDQLTRLGAFASTGKATDGPIADIRNRAGKAMAGRGLNPGAAGLKSKGGKKKAAGKKGGGSKGGGSKGGGGKSGGGGGGGKKGGGGGKKGGGGSKSSAKKPAAKKPAPKPTPKPTPKPATPALRSTRPGTPGRPGRPGGRGGLPTPQPPSGGPGRRRRPGTGPGTQPVRSSAAPLESLAEWNAARYRARRDA